MSEQERETEAVEEEEAAEVEAHIKRSEGPESSEGTPRDEPDVEGHIK